MTTSFILTAMCHSIYQYLSKFSLWRLLPCNHRLVQCRLWLSPVWNANDTEKGWKTCLPQFQDIAVQINVFVLYCLDTLAIKLPRSFLLFFADEFDSYIVVSFINATLVLSIGETVEEVTDSGFLGTTPTLSCSQLGEDALLQVLYLQ